MILSNTLQRPWQSPSWHGRLSAKPRKENLKDQTFMQGEYVQNMVVVTADSVEGQWSEMTTQMALYLDSPATRSILLKPVSRKIARLMEESRQFVGQTVDGENGWDATIRVNVLQQLDKIERAVKKVVNKPTAPPAAAVMTTATVATTEEATKQ